MKEERVCPICKKTFVPHKAAVVNQRFCSADCKRQNYQRSKVVLPGGNLISSGTVGAISELIASANLLSLGFEVYRALSPCSRCDLIGIRDGKTYEFEVRTAIYNPCDKKVSYVTKDIRASNVIAVTLVDKKVHFFPDIESK